MSVSDAEEPKDQMPRRSRRPLVWGLGVIVVLAVVVGIAVVVFDRDASGRTADCPATKKPTGHSRPEELDPERQLKLVDSGLKPYKADTGLSDPEQGVSFGYLLKNTTKYVLYDATIQVRFVDDDGDDPTSMVGNSKKKNNSQYLDDVPVPVVFPGQKVGMGGLVTTWTKFVERGENDVVTPDKVDYDELDIEVTVTSGDWWEQDNDEYEFTKATTKNVDVDVEENPDKVYLDGTKANLYNTRYSVDLASCRELRAHTASSLVYNADGEIVGGSISGKDPTSHAYYAPGLNTNNPEDQASGPEGDSTVKIYSYAQPKAPSLSQ